MRHRARHEEMHSRRVQMRALRTYAIRTRARDILRRPFVVIMSFFFAARKSSVYGLYLHDLIARVSSERVKGKKKERNEER